jgi:hypothetical protein
MSFALLYLQNTNEMYVTVRYMSGNLRYCTPSLFYWFLSEMFRLKKIKYKCEYQVWAEGCRYTFFS